MTIWRGLSRSTALLIATVAMASLLIAPSTPSAGAAPPAGGDQRYSWPVTPRPPVLRRFEPPPQRWLAGHRGVDLAAAAGSAIVAAGDGVVHFSGSVAGKPVVSVRHRDGLLTTYEPVTGTIRAGTAVTRGAPIGVLESGHPGCRRPCLHWGARRGAGASAVYIDPLALLGVVRVRLKPLQPGDE